MTHLLVNLYPHGQEWCGEYFPDRSLGMLPLGGRLLVEYFINLGHGCKFDSLLILEKTFNRHLMERLAEFRRGDLPLHYCRGGEATVRSFLIARQTKHSSDYLIIHGAVIPKSHSRQELEESFVPCYDDGCADGIYRYKNGVLLRSRAEFYRIHSLQSYFETNFSLLADENSLLPGYSVNGRIHTCSNVGIRLDSELIGPLVLGDNTFIEKECRLSNAVLGERSLVDKGSVIEHSIIFDRTYVAGNLEIRNKIVTPGRIIDPATGGVLDRNKFSYVFSPMQNRSAGILRLWEYGIALLLAFGLLIPYLLLLPYYLSHKKSFLCWKLSMDRYPGYWAVLFFRKELIKSHPDQEKFVFQMGESYALLNTPEQRRIYDYYYHYHCSCILMLQVVLRCLGKRGFATLTERRRSQGVSRERAAEGCTVTTSDPVIRLRKKKK